MRAPATSSPAPAKSPRAAAFPETAAELRKLPGIGDYTAAAIAAIAFGERPPAVDTNVERVVARLHGLERPSPGRTSSGCVLAMMPAERAGDFAQAMMDLGATDLPARRRRAAASCPLRPDCAAFASGDARSLPGAEAQRRVRPHRHGIAWWIERDGQVWLVRRPAKGMLGGMAALPGRDWTEAARPTRPGIGTVRHVFTHFALDLDVVRRVEPVGEGWWQPLDAARRGGPADALPPRRRACACERAEAARAAA